jgi:hypothetical protein
MAVEEKVRPAPLFAAHGSARLPLVDLNSYNLELKDGDKFLGDRASKRAFWAIFDKWRKPLIKAQKDPFGGRSSDEIGRKELDAALDGEAEAAGLVHALVEEFAQELAFVTKRFLKEKSWQRTERIVIGGGLRSHRVGELAIGRLGMLLKADDIDIEITLIEHDPDDAGLLGAVRLLPAWTLKGHDAILAADIGGTNMRVGMVTFDLKKSPNFENATIEHREIWRHADEDTDRDSAVEALVDMLRKAARRAEKDGARIAPFIGVGCPGIVEADGTIDRGAQNLPGNWQSARFNLPESIMAGIPLIDGQETHVIVHNDAVVQGLSAMASMQDVEHWGVLTLGTGLGNARFTNRIPARKPKK